jgi:hypothetical protein
MAAFDFMPWKGVPENCLLWAPLNASESFREGELVGINSDGELAEFPADGTPALLADIDTNRTCGVALMNGDTTRTDGHAAATGNRVTFAPADAGIIFITNNITDGSGTAVVPTGTMRGLAVTVEHNNGAWALIPGAAATFGTHVAALIVDVLDSQKTPITATDTTTGVYALFQLVTATRG